MAIGRMQMNRQLYGLGGYFPPENGREKFGLGSKLKRFVRKIIPNEVSEIAVKAAPFVAPFNPLLAGYMAGIGGFDQTGRIGSSLKRGLLTYGGGQLARGIGGAGFQQGINPFSNVSFSGGIMSGLGQTFTSPVSGAPMFGQAQFAPDPNQLTEAQTYLQDQAATSSTSVPGSTTDVVKQLSQTPEKSKSYGDIFKSLTSGNLTEMGTAAKELGGKALKDIYTNPITNQAGEVVGSKLDKTALLATLVTIPSYLDAKKAADDAGLEEFDEATYNAERDKYMASYKANLPDSAFGIENKANGGRIGYGFGSLVKASDFAKPSEGQTVQPLGTIMPSPINNSGGGGLGLMSRLISQNPNLFKRTPTNMTKGTSVNQLFNYYKDKETDEARRQQIIDLFMRDNAATGGRIGYGDGTKPSAEENTPSQEIIDRRIAQIKDMSKRGADIDTIKSITGASDQMIKDVLGQANGGRIGYKQGTPKEGIVSLTDEDSGVIYRDPDTEEPITKEEFLRRTQEDEDRQYMSPTDQGSGVIYRNEKGEPITKNEWLRLTSEAPSITLPEKKAKGGRMGYAMGSEVPVRRNEGGITELDYRNTGGFVPIGVKEKADDVPAMLSKNEFVFTADAVRAAGGGSVQKGAQKMYNTMKMLEGKLV
jgi:hypothetical protein